MTRVLHPVVICTDLERSLAFYAGVVGMHPGVITDHDPDLLSKLSGRESAGRAVILTGDDGSELELAAFRTPPTQDDVPTPWEVAGLRSVTFVVEDLAATLARARAAGYSDIGETVDFDQTMGELAVVYLTGPDSVIVTLAQKR